MWVRSDANATIARQIEEAQRELEKMKARKEAKVKELTDIQAKATEHAQLQVPSFLATRRTPGTQHYKSASAPW